MSARQVGAVMLVCLGLWTFLDAPALYHNAQASPIGTRRSVALAVLHPIARTAAALGVDRVVRISDDVIGRHPHTPTPLPPPAPVVPPTGPVKTSGGPHPPVAPAAIPPLRIPTVANPLRVLIVGDSIGLSFGQGLATSLDATNVVKATVDAREGTGLARPDSFDWPAQLRADMAQLHPDVVVAMFGGNDDQDVQVNGRYIGFGTTSWQEVYAARVQQFAAEVRADSARLLWSGLPVMRSAAKTARFTTVMNVTRAAVAADPWALFVDNSATLSGSSGQYVDALPNASGQEVIVREPDGVHVSPAGAGRLAATAVAAMTAHWHLDLSGHGSGSTASSPPP
jgi:hypothetical protein